MPPPLPESKPDLSLSIGTNGAAGINVSVEVNGVVYSGESWERRALAGSGDLSIYLIYG